MFSRDTLFREKFNGTKDLGDAMFNYVDAKNAP